MTSETSTLLPEERNQTPQDAYHRVLQARIGCMHKHSTDDYLFALRDQVAMWLRAIELRCNARLSEHNKEVLGSER